MIPTEDIISIVKNTITASIKCNTHRGYIGWSSCDNICMDMHDCLDMCAETLEMRGYMVALATVYKGNIIKNLIMDCQSYTKYRPNETTGGIFVSWRRKEELPTGA